MSLTAVLARVSAELAAEQANTEPYPPQQRAAEQRNVVGLVRELSRAVSAPGVAETAAWTDQDVSDALAAAQATHAASRTELAKFESAALRRILPVMIAVKEAKL
jgi:hypothetical protein